MTSFHKGLAVYLNAAEPGPYPSWSGAREAMCHAYSRCHRHVVVCEYEDDSTEPPEQLPGWQRITWAMCMVSPDPRVVSAVYCNVIAPQGAMFASAHSLTAPPPPKSDNTGWDW